MLQTGITRASSWADRLAARGGVPEPVQTMAPKRDIAATDGMKITLGDTTVTLWETPGHTPGTLPTHLPCGQGKPVEVAYSGGTAFNSSNTPTRHPEFPDLYRSQRHFAEQATLTTQP